MTVQEVLQKGERSSRKKWPSFSGALQNLHLMSSFLALLNKNPFQTSPERMALNNMLSRSLSSEQRQVVDESHKHRNKAHPETLSFYTDQRQLDPAKLAKWHNGSAGYHTQRKEAGPHPTSLLRVPEKANFLGRVDKKMNGPMSRGPQ